MRQRSQSALVRENEADTLIWDGVVFLNEQRRRRFYEPPREGPDVQMNQDNEVHVDPQEIGFMEMILNMFKGRGPRGAVAQI
jgi:hypothetical protein